MKMGTGAGSRLYNIWQGMKQRCLNPASASYPTYGGRGIGLCDDWHHFLPFIDWALENGYAADRQIDRIDNDSSYEPENCRWVTAGINASRRLLDPTGAYLTTMRGKLDEKQLEGTQPSDEPYKLYDGGGLYLHVLTSGVRVWRLRFRHDSKELLLTLGRFPEMPLGEARELRAINRARLKRGRNPTKVKAESRRRRQRRQAQTERFSATKPDT